MKSFCSQYEAPKTHKTFLNYNLNYKFDYNVWSVKGAKKQKCGIKLTQDSR